MSILKPYLWQSGSKHNLQKNEGKDTKEARFLAAFPHQNAHHQVVEVDVRNAFLLFKCSSTSLVINRSFICIRQNLKRTALISILPPSRSQEHFET